MGWGGAGCEGWLEPILLLGSADLHLPPRGAGLWPEKICTSTTLTFFCSLCLQLTMAKRVQARRLDGIDHNPW